MSKKQVKHSDADRKKMHSKVIYIGMDKRRNHSFLPGNERKIQDDQNKQKLLLKNIHAKLY